MYFIALQMLFGDRGKYIAMVVGITFAALIMTQQPAIFVGLMSRTYSFIGDVSQPDIWVMDPGVQYVEEHKPMRDTDLARVRGVAGVEWAAPMYKNFMTAKLPDGQTKTIDLTGLDDATLIGAPPQMVAGQLSDIRRTDGIIVNDEAATNRLRVKLPDGSDRPLQIGDELEINDRRAVVVGLAKVTRNFVLQPQVYTTYSRAITYAPPNRRQLTYVLVKAQKGVAVEELAARIRAATGLAAHPAEDFKWITLNYWMTNTGIPINFGISVFLGFVVGAAVAGQAFFNFVRENLKQYAALKAMGLRNGVLVRMVLLQAAVVGFIGYGLGCGLTALFGMQVHDSVLAFKMPPLLLLFAGIGVLLIITIAALFAIRHVVKVDPAVVFRN
jgi:putative ABC transport system permease protein